MAMRPRRPDLAPRRRQARAGAGSKVLRSIQGSIDRHFEITMGYGVRRGFHRVSLAEQPNHNPLTAAGVVVRALQSRQEQLSLAVET